MSDNLTRYFAIQKALVSLRPTSATGNFARHLNTLGMLVSGIVGAGNAIFPPSLSMSLQAGSPKAESARWRDGSIMHVSM